jgi:uncharacterized protein
VRKLNALHVELVRFAGDLTYDPPKNLSRARAAAETGQTDVRGARQPRRRTSGTAARRQDHRVLAGSPLHFVEDRVIDFPDFRLVGLHDWWSGRDDTTFLEILPHDKPLLVPMKQPHSLRGVDFALAMAGHTHGGQVSIPWLTDAVFLPSAASAT